MADIKNKNELKRRIDLFLDDEIDYSINEEFCKETMRMMKEFIGHASHRLDCADSKTKSSQDKLKQYQKLEKNGILLRLPCKVGDTVYFISKYTNSVLKGTVETIGLRENFRRDRILIKVKTVADDYFYDDDFGKTVFLTKEEAEAKMTEMKNK